LVSGFDTATSLSRSSRVDRRFTNVVLAFRSVSGSSVSAWSRELFSCAIAPNVVFVLLTRLVRSSLRSASAVTVEDVSRTKRVSTFWSSASSAVTSLVDTRKGEKYFVACRASSPLPSYWSARPRITFCRPRRVRGLSVLKSVSMSTGAVVSSVPILPPSSIFFALFGPG
jgi:hypothetical protein